jgi:chorismate mutase
LTRDEAIHLLAATRRQIDDLDIRILNLLNERAAIVEQIGGIKQSASMPIYEPTREDQVFDNVRAHNRGPLKSDAVKRVFERIIDEMRKVQADRMDRTEHSGKTQC